MSALGLVYLLCSGLSILVPPFWLICLWWQLFCLFYFKVAISVIISIVENINWSKKSINHWGSKYWLADMIYISRDCGWFSRNRFSSIQLATTTISSNWERYEFALESRSGDAVTLHRGDFTSERYWWTAAQHRQLPHCRSQRETVSEQRQCQPIWI